MRNIARPIAFVMASTNHGTMIVNRNDYHMVQPGQGYGVGYQLLGRSGFDQPEVDLVLNLLEGCRRRHGDGVVAIDCGANVGVHTVEWARTMYGWGEVVAFEAQEKVYYALAGNIAINNCFNATAYHGAVGAACGKLDIPVPDYFSPSSYGSLELKQRTGTEFIGQKIDYAKTRPVTMYTLDSLALPRVDFIKIDVEGMEEEVLAGAADLLARCRPAMLIEIIKSNVAAIEATLQARGYLHYRLGINLLAIHRDSPMAQGIRREGDLLHINF